MTRPLFRHADPAPEPLMSFGRMAAAIKHLRDQLTRLPDSQNDYYGTLQTMRSATAVLVGDLDLLIDAHDGNPSPHGTIHVNQPAAEPALEVVRKIPVVEPPAPRELKRRGRPPRTEPGPKPEPAEEGAPRVTVREKIIRFLATKGPANTMKVRNHLSQNGHDLDLGPVEQHLFLAKRDGKVIEADGLWSAR